MSTKYSETTLIKLTRGYSAIIDSIDAPCIQGYKWHAVPKYEERRRKDSAIYAVTDKVVDGKLIQLRMHRLVAENCGYSLDGLVVDHINGNGLDNRRCNLRIATNSQNAQNRRPTYNSVSQFKGVSIRTGTTTWVAQIKTPTGYIRIGDFKSETDAAKAYDAYAFVHHGEFAYLNLPNQPIWTIEEANNRKNKKIGSSGYYGVTLRSNGKKGERWKAQIYHQRRHIIIGDKYSTPEEAALAYNEAAIRLKGDKAKLNIIPQP